MTCHPSFSTMRTASHTNSSSVHSAWSRLCTDVELFKQAPSLDPRAWWQIFKFDFSQTDGTGTGSIAIQKNINVIGWYKSSGPEDLFPPSTFF